jgi:hypothetical protein
VITGGVCSHAIAGFGLGKREDGVRGASSLECADFLKVLALEEELRARE